MIYIYIYVWKIGIPSKSSGSSSFFPIDFYTRFGRSHVGTWRRLNAQKVDDHIQKDPPRYPLVMTNIAIENDHL